jgi:NAD(P)-dependent dehydrogenase (short-subunit alcohol dehydrogenase family)
VLGACGDTSGDAMSDQTMVAGAFDFIGFHIARRLLAEGRDVIGLDSLNSLANAQSVQKEYELALTEPGALQPADAVILPVAHNSYVQGGWPLIRGLLHDGAGLVLDVKARLDRDTLPDGVELWRL